MFGKESKLYSIFKMKCPQCHEGDFFLAHPYNLRKAGELHKNCPSCGLKYAKEPGFYYGAMYVSYALGVALFVGIWMIFYLFFPTLSAWWILSTLTIVTVLLGPYLYALSKIIWANMFIKYDKEALKKSV